MSPATSVINELKQPQIDPWKRLSEAFQREKERGAIDWSAWLLSFFTEISLRNEELSHSRLWSIVYRLAPRFCFFLFLITGAAKLSRIDSSVSRTDGVMGEGRGRARHVEAGMRGTGVELWQRGPRVGARPFTAASGRRRKTVG